MRPGAHEDFTPHNAPRAASDRHFGLVFCAVFVAVALWPVLRHSAVRAWALAAAVAFLLVALLRPPLLNPLNRAWAGFGRLLGRVVNPAAMCVLFYAVITPVALWRRLLGKDPLRLRPDGGTTSYWVERNEEQGSMEDQF